MPTVISEEQYDKQLDAIRKYINDDRIKVYNINHTNPIKLGVMLPGIGVIGLDQAEDFANAITRAVGMANISFLNGCRVRYED